MKKPFPFGGLRRRIILFMVISLFVCIGLFTLLYERVVTEKFMEQASSQARLVTESINLGLLQNKDSDHRARIQLFLRDITDNTEITEVMIADREDRVMFSSRPEFVGRSLQHMACGDLRDGRSWKIVRNSKGSGREGCYLRQVLNRPTCYECHPAATAKLGKIALRISLESSDAVLRASHYLFLGAIPLVLIILSAANIHLISRRVITPIRKLRYRFEELGAGNLYGEGKTNPVRDEIGLLHLRFEEMLDKLRDTQSRELARVRERAGSPHELIYEEKLNGLRNQLKKRSRDLDRFKLQARTHDREIGEKDANLQRAAKNISSLNKVGVALSSELDIDRLVQLLINISVKGLRAEIGLIMLIGEDDTKLVMRGWSGLGNKIDLTLPVSTGESVSGTVARTGRPLLLRRVDGSYGIKSVSRYGFARRSVICAPMRIKQRLLGTIELTNKRGEESFNEDDLEMLKAIANQAAVAVDNARLYQAIQNNYFATIRALVQAVEEKDKYTRGHSERVTTYSLKVAKRMNFSEKKLRTLRYAGVLHDIGKIGIPENILQKPGTLTSKEYNEVKKHPEIGTRIVSPIEFLRDILPGVGQHHERFDGAGYPQELTGKKVAIEARILTVADAYDAMITERPYRSPLTKEEAIAELRRCSGTQFDPLVVENFIEILETDPEILKMEESLSSIGT